MEALLPPRPFAYSRELLLPRASLAAITLCTILFASSFAIGSAADVQLALDQARTCEKAQDYAGAERAYRRALSLAPRDLEALKRYGILLQTELKFAQSLEILERVLALDSQYPQVNFYLGVSYLGENEFQKACDAFQKEILTRHAHPRCHYYYAIALQSLGRTDAAIAQYNQSLAQNPKDLDALYQLARLHMQASLQAIQRVTDLDPDSFQLHALMGEIYSYNHRYHAALKEYLAAQAKRPDAPGLHYAIGTAYRNLKMIDQAQKEFLEAKREDPNDPRVNLYLGEFAVGRRDYAGAIGYLQIVAIAQPEMARPHFLLGECYEALKEFDEAKGELLAAIQDEPKDPQPHYLLAQIYREQGNTLASAGEFRKFQELSLAAKQQTVKRAQTTPQ